MTIVILIVTLLSLIVSFIGAVAAICSFYSLNVIVRFLTAAQAIPNELLKHLEQVQFDPDVTNLKKKGMH